MKKFLVGGAVRDQLLNFPFSEKDWVVVGSTPEKMIKLGYTPVGKDFPVFLHPETKEEYALARTERKTAPGYKGFTFYADPSVTLEEDLERRDLTINAIAQDDTGELFDPFDGQEDIEQRRLQHVSLAFAEDPVRILRVARFSARYHYLGFTVAESTMDLMYAMVAKGETKHLVPERIWQELAKALQEKTPSLFFTILKLCGALGDIFPELDNEHYQNSVQLLSRLSGQSEHSEMRFAALCYPLSKTSIENLCERLRAPGHFRETAILLKQHAQSLVEISQKAHEVNPNDLANVLKQLDAPRKPERFSELAKGSAQLFGLKDPKPMLAFWEEAIKHYQNVDPQLLIEQGFTKAELGDAIFQQRLDHLTHFLSHYKDKS